MERFGSPIQVQKLCKEKTPATSAKVQGASPSVSSLAQRMLWRHGLISPVEQVDDPLPTSQAAAAHASVGPAKLQEAPRGSARLREAPRGSARLREAPRGSARLREAPRGSARLEHFSAWGRQEISRRFPAKQMRASALHC